MNIAASIIVFWDKSKILKIFCLKVSTNVTEFNSFNNNKW